MPRKDIQFPYGLDDDKQLYIASDFASQRVQAEVAINANTITIAAGDATKFPATGYFACLVNQEVMLLGNRAGTILQVIERSINSVPLDVIPVNTQITLVQSQIYHNSVRDAIIAIESEFGFYRRPLINARPNAVPGAPTDKDSYIVTATAKINPSSANPWALAKVGDIATWDIKSVKWQFYTPVIGVHVWDSYAHLTWFAIEDPTSVLPPGSKPMIWIPDNYLNQAGDKIVDLLDSLQILKVRTPVALSGKDSFRVGSAYATGAGQKLAFGTDGSNQKEIPVGLKVDNSITGLPRFTQQIQSTQTLFAGKFVWGNLPTVDSAQKDGRANKSLTTNTVVRKISFYPAEIGNLKLIAWLSRPGQTQVDLYREFPIFEYTKTIVAGDLGALNDFVLPNPIVLENGNVLNFEWYGCKLKGEDLTGFKPMLSFEESDFQYSNLITEREIKWREVKGTQTALEKDVNHLERISVDNSGAAVELTVQLTSGASYFEVTDFQGTFKLSQPVKVVIKGTPDDTEYQLTKANGTYMFQQFNGTWKWSIK